ncbi:hypothetical protein D3C76_1384020 [compost metagenome]
MSNELAAIDQPDAIAIFRLIHKVGGDHHGDAFFNHAVDVEPKLAAGEGINT